MALVDEVVKDISDQLRALRQDMSPQKVEEIIGTYLGKLDENDPIVRKMRFGRADPALIGSKFERHRFTAADVEFLYDWQTASRLAGLSKGPSADLENAFKVVSDAYYMSEEDIRKIDQRAIDNLFPRVPKHQMSGIGVADDYYRAQMQRAMDTAESGFGQQLVGTQYVHDLWEGARSESRIFNLVDTFEMTDASAYLPVEVNIPEPIFVGESTTFNATNYATVKTGSQRVLVSAKKLLWHQMWSRELEEDSLIPFVAFLRRQITLGISFYSDSMIMNGDDTTAGTGNINSDDAAPAGTKFYLAFDGIRHGAIVDNTANHVTTAGALTLNQLRDLRGLMIDPTNLMDWGHPNDFNDLVFACDPATGDRIALLDEVVSAKVQNASNANLLNGEVARILGHPVITTMAVSQTDADGKFTTTSPSTADIYGQVVAFNRRGFKIGWRRRIKVELEALPGTDQSRAVYSVRFGLGRFTPSGAASGIESVAVKSAITL